MTIRKSIWVARTPEISFKVFCEKITEWWPGGFGGRDSRLFLEGQVGGRFYEGRADGTEYEIGRITAYEPPSLVAFTEDNLESVERLLIRTLSSTGIEYTLRRLRAHQESETTMAPNTCGFLSR